MDKSQELLKKFSSTDAKYFELHSGEGKRVKFLFMEQVPNEFKDGKGTIMRYHLEENGKEKIWDRVSKQLIREMAKVSEGDWIIIKRMGEGKDTTYSVTKTQ